MERRVRDKTPKNRPGGRYPINDIVHLPEHQIARVRGAGRPGGHAVSGAR
jgi:hypothetical protein